MIVYFIVYEVVRQEGHIGNRDRQAMFIIQGSFCLSLRRIANLTALPPMPADSGTWSGLHSWAMPTSSFVELVLFAR